MIKEGTKCRVLADNMNNFRPGDIVVALDSDIVPYCCLLENYAPDKRLNDYNLNLVYALLDSELEVLDDDRTE